MIFVKRQICILAHKKEQLFGKVVDGTVQLSPVVEIVHEQWLKNPTNISNVLLDTFVIMPNHIRRNGILVITDSTVHTGKGKAFSPDFAKSGENALPLQPVFLLCPRRDSNPQPTDSKSGTLSIELRGHLHPDYTAMPYFWQLIETAHIMCAVSLYCHGKGDAPGLRY